MGRLGRAVALIAVGVAGGGAAFAIASVPDSSNVIHACVAVTPGTTVPVGVTGQSNVRIIDPSAGQGCNTVISPAGLPPTEIALNWNQSGPTGPQGLLGATGATGATGGPNPAGTVTSSPPTGTGTAGTGTVVSPSVPGGSIVTLPGGATFTISGQPAPTLELARLTGSASSHRLTLSIDGMDLGLGSYALGPNAAGSSANKVHDISITKTVDKSSATLLKACATGKHFPTAILTARKAGGTPYLQIKMTNVIISSYQSAGEKGSQPPAEALTLNFTSVSFSYAK